MQTPIKDHAVKFSCHSFLVSFNLKSTQLFFFHHTDNFEESGTSVSQNGLAFEFVCLFPHDSIRVKPSGQGNYIGDVLTPKSFLKQQCQHSVCSSRLSLSSSESHAPVLNSQFLHCMVPLATHITLRSPANTVPSLSPNMLMSEKHQDLQIPLSQRLHLTEETFCCKKGKDPRRKGKWALSRKRNPDSSPCLVRKDYAVRIPFTLISCYSDPGQGKN